MYQNHQNETREEKHDFCSIDLEQRSILGILIDTFIHQITNEKGRKEFRPHEIQYVYIKMTNLATRQTRILMRKRIERNTTKHERNSARQTKMRQSRPAIL